MKDIWSPLFVKCFKLILLFLYMTTNAWANTVQVYPYTETIKTGDVVEVEIQSELDSNDLEKYKYKRIHQNLFVLDFKVSGTQRIFSVFVANTPKQKKEAEETRKYPFELINSNIDEQKQVQIPDFHIKDKEYSHESSQVSYVSMLIYLLLALTVLIIFLFLYKKIKMKNKNKFLKNELIKMKDFITNAKTREDFEFIYKHRKDILKYYKEIDGFDLFLKELNKIQFKKEWSPEELEEMKLLKSKLGIVEINNGI